MGFDASLITLLGLQLILKAFESRNEEKLEERLKIKSKEDIVNILLSKNISVTKKEINLEKEKRKKLINSVANNLKVYHLGQDTTTDSVPDIINSLIQQKYPNIETFDGTSTLKIFIPDDFSIIHPKIISESAYQRNFHDSKRQKEFTSHYDLIRVGAGAVPVSKKPSVKGHTAENLCYDDIKEYFNKRIETVLVIHGLCMFRLDPKKGQKGSEKDFIIVNYTYSYIMTIEVKSILSLNERRNGRVSSVEKSANQLKGAFKHLEELFGEDIKGSWWFIPMVYCSSMDKEVGEVLKNKSDFIFCQSVDRSFASKMDKLVNHLNETRKNEGLKNSETFKTVAKYLIFAVSDKELPVKGSMINKMIK